MIANRWGKIASALQWDGGRGLWLAALLVAMAAVLDLGDNASAWLRYDRSAIGAGGWWRLLTAHIVHRDARHLVLNNWDWF